MLLGLVAGCTKDDTAPQGLTINGYWYDRTDNPKFRQYFNTKDSTHTIEDLKGGKKYSGKFWLLPLNKIHILGSDEAYQMDRNNLQYTSNKLVR